MKKIESHVASFVLILAVLFCCPCHGQDTPVPAEAELKKVNSLINELFRKQISAAKEPEELVAIAKELRYSALEAGEKPQHYGLLKKAIELAGLAGDVTLGVAYIELLDDEFDIDLKQETLDLLGECSSGKRDATDFGVLATHIAGMIDGEIPTQDTGYLKKLASVGSKIASKSKDKELIQRFKDYKKSISALAKMAANLEAARNKVKTTPDDAAANKVLGEHYCLVKQDWDVGLGYLAKATGLLGEIAKLEKSAPSEPEKQQELARAWVKYSGASKGFEDESIARARDWHEKAIANLSGFKKKRAQLELSELKEVAVKVVYLGGFR